MGRASRLSTLFFMGFERIPAEAAFVQLEIARSPSLSGGCGSVERPERLCPALDSAWPGPNRHASHIAQSGGGGNVGSDDVEPRRKTPRSAERKGQRMSANLYDLIRAQSAVEPASPLLETPAGRRFVYGDLDARTGQIANLLHAHGVRPGERVAVQAAKSPEAVFLYLACLRAGAVYLPLNIAYTLAELDYFFTDAEPALIVCGPEHARDIAELPGARASSVLTLDAAGRGSLGEAAADAPGEFATVARTSDDLAAILYTSGTTGRSKGAMLSHGNLAANALALREAWGFTAADVLLHVLPIYHTHGLFVAINTTLLAGARMIFLPRFEPGAVLEALPRASVMMGVPTYYVRLLARADFAGELARNMRLFVSGSAPLLEDTFHAFEARTGQRILERYGMTETGMNTSNPLHGERRPGTVGLPLAGVEVRVADEQGRVLPPGATGVLEVRGPNVFRGYWRMPEKTAEEFRPDGFFITGDVARIDRDGYVSIVGRARDLIISGGLNVYPKEIESVIDGLEGVEESAVIGVPHPDFGEGVVAVVKPRAGARATDAEAVIAGARARLAPFKTPKRVVFIDELPRNSMGKVQKNLLRETYGDMFRGDSE
jgi:malonyl-CoA/methylmalonyl-CoA synthetase